MIEISCNKVIGRIHNFWNNIHFHPTDAIEDEWGQAILNSVARDGVAETVRMYAMLEDIVTMDADGNLHYDFTENDVRMDYMVSKGFNILLSYNFLPPCLAEDNNHFQHANKKGTRYKGKMICTSRLKDESLWEEVCYRYTEHIVERYGIERVEKWYLECYNEPDIPMFFMTELGHPPMNTEKRVQEYLRLYRGFSRGVKRVDSRLRVGGPATAGQWPFYEMALEGIKTAGLDFDFFSGHSYGTDPPLLNDGSRPLTPDNILERIEQYREVLNKYFPGVEMVIDEWGACTCGFYNREECPQLMFREGSEYAAYFGKLVEGGISKELGISKLMICLSGQHDLPCDFSGYRNFMGLNLIKKPIYNAYVLMRKLGSQRIYAKTDVRELTMLASADTSGGYAVMLSYAAEHFDKMIPDVSDIITLRGIEGKRRVKVWCIDENHTNPYKYAKAMGLGDLFSAEEIEKLREVGEMKPIAEYDAVFDGNARIPVEFTANALVMIEISDIIK